MRLLSNGPASSRKLLYVEAVGPRMVIIGRNAAHRETDWCFQKLKLLSFPPPTQHPMMPRPLAKIGTAAGRGVQMAIYSSMYTKRESRQAGGIFIDGSPIMRTRWWDNKLRYL